MSRQLAFDLPLREALGREDFMVSPANVLALEALSGWRDWPGGRMLLVGPEGAGKTHLAHVWAAETQAVIVAGVGLGGQDLPGLASFPAVIVEDADRIEARADETALFHLHNMIASQGGCLLITARVSVRDWAAGLPDLISRLQAIAVTRLEPPDDALLAAVLVKLFSDRQIAVAPTLVPYLVSRMNRSFAAARALVAQLDARALAEGRAITRSLAAEVLEYPQTAHRLPDDIS